jgi:hypothetical protein
VVQITVIFIVVHAKADDEDVGDHETNEICEIPEFQVSRILLVEEG